MEKEPNPPYTSTEKIHLENPNMTQEKIQQDSNQDAHDVLSNALLAGNRQLDREVKNRLAEKKEIAANKELLIKHDYILPAFENDIRSSLRENGYNIDNLPIVPPADNVKGAEGVDLAFNIASLSKSLSEKVDTLSPKVAEVVSLHPMVAEVRTLGPFINIVLDYSQFAPKVLEKVEEQGDHYGHFNEGNGDVLIVDYSSPNIAKNMTVAHLRSTIIGHSLSKIHDAAGYTSFRVNHLGDWGTQFGKIIYQYRKEIEKDPKGFQERLEGDPVNVLLEIYRGFVAQEEDNPDSLKDAQQLFLELEKGDPELVALWRKFRDWSLQEFAKVYDRLHIQFDALQGESFYEDRMDKVVEEGLSGGMLRKNDEGSVVFPGQAIYDPLTKKENDKVMRAQRGSGKAEEDEIQWKDEVVQKPSGGTVYLTRDLAGIRYRTQELDADKILYVIGKEQKKHCAILMNMASQMGWNQIGDSLHIPFGHLNVDGRKMKSRQGKVVLLNDVLDESISAAEKMLRERKSDSQGVEDVQFTDEERETARKIGIGSVIYGDLRQNRESDIEFNADAAGSIESGTCPYIQYTYCRLRAISEKLGEPEDTTAYPEEGLSPEEKKLIMSISQLPNVIESASKTNSPHRIASFLEDLSQRINVFYQKRHIGNTEGAKRDFRLALVKECQQVLKNAASLLHIELPEKM